MRHLCSLLALLVFPVCVVAQDDGAQALAAPANLSSSVYSSTAAELFWDRVAGQALQYEVSRDGEFLEVSDGTSYFTDSLARGQSYVFEVVAIDERGVRSTASRVTLDTTGSGFAPPANARLTVYSRTAAELFWDRYAPSAGAVTVDVTRDGVPIGETDGISFYDDGRTRGVDHVYALVATDSNGRTSAAARVTGGSAAAPGEGIDADLDPGTDGDAPDTVEADAGGTVADETDGDGTEGTLLDGLPGLDIERIVTGVMGVLHGVPYQRSEAIAARLALASQTPLGDDIAGFSLLEEQPAEASDVGTFVYGCEEGGTLTVAAATDFGTVLALDDCRLDSSVVNGDVFAAAEAGISLMFDPLEVIHTDATSERWIGGIEFFRAFGVLSAGVERSASLFERSTPAGSTRITAAVVEYAVLEGGGGEPSYRHSAQFEVSAPFTDGLPFTAFSDEPFENLSADGHYQTGTLSIVASDGRSITLDAGTGDAGTYRLDVSAGGELTTSVRSWDDLVRLPCLSDQADVGACETINELASSLGLR